MASPSDDMPGDPPETIAVNVQWCGINFPMSVPAEANIQDLKRQICEVAGLPSKRQKYSDTDTKLNDDYHVGSLQVPRIANLISLNEKATIETYKSSYHAMEPNCTVEPTKDRLVDFDKSKTKLYKGKYKVGSMEIDCLIKYYNGRQRPDLLRSIKLMRRWSHPNLVMMENLYQEKNNTVQRLILSNNITGTLEKYIKPSTSNNEEASIDKKEEAKHEDKISNADGTFTIFFQKMIIDLCSLLDQMVKRKICPRDLARENLYLKQMEDAEPELRILFNNVDLLDGPNQKLMLTSLCQNIKVICTPDVHKDAGTEAFCNFLGKEAIMFIGKNLTRTAMFYPINWSNAQKAKYLMDLIPASNEVWAAINQCGIMWPTEGDGDIYEELQTLKKLIDTENDQIRGHNQNVEEEMLPFQEDKMKIESEEKDDEIRKQKLGPINTKLKEIARKLKREIIWNYDTRCPYDLVRMIRNHWKHFDNLPSSIQTHLKDKDATLANLERWCPNVWILIYNAVGLGC